MIKKDRRIFQILFSIFSYTAQISNNQIKIKQKYSINSIRNAVNNRFTKFETILFHVPMFQKLFSSLIFYAEFEEQSP